MNLVPIWFELVPLCTLSLSYSAVIAFRYLTMSQTLWQLAPLRSRSNAAADTLARYEASPAAHHHMEEATYGSGALAVEEVVAWAASLDPAPEVIHIELHSPSRVLSWGEGLVNRVVGGTPLPGSLPSFFTPSRHARLHGPIVECNAYQPGGEDQGHPHPRLPHH